MMVDVGVSVSVTVAVGPSIQVDNYVSFVLKV